MMDEMANSGTPPSTGTTKPENVPVGGGDDNKQKEETGSDAPLPSGRRPFYERRGGYGSRTQGVEPPSPIEIPTELLPEGAVDITKNQCRKLWKLVLQHGVNGAGEDLYPPPREGMVAKIHYTSWLLKDEQKVVFDSSRFFDSDDEPVEFVIGDFQVIRAIDEGVRTMQVGETALLIAHFDYAYGRYSERKANFANIPNESFICSEVELLEVADEVIPDLPKEIVKETVTENPDGLMMTENAIAFVTVEGFYEDKVFFPKITLPIVCGGRWGYTEASTVSTEIPDAVGQTVFTMKEGEKAWITATGMSAYEKDFESKGSGLNISAGDTIKFMAEVNEIEELYDPFLLSLKEKIEYCEELVRKGVLYQGLGCDEAAASKFARVIEYLEEATHYLKSVSEDLSKQLNVLLFAALMNLAKSFYKLKFISMKDALKNFENAGCLTSVDGFEEAYYERGLLLMTAKEYEAAKLEFNKVVELTPSQNGTLYLEAKKKAVEANDLAVLQAKKDPLRYYPPK